MGPGRRTLAISYRTSLDGVPSELLGAPVHGCLLSDARDRVAGDPDRIDCVFASRQKTFVALAVFDASRLQSRSQLLPARPDALRACRRVFRPDESGVVAGNRAPAVPDDAGTRIDDASDRDS